MQPTSMVLIRRKDPKSISFKFPHNDCYKDKDDSLQLSWISEHESNDKFQINQEIRSNRSIARKFKSRQQLNVNLNNVHLSNNSYQSKQQFQSKIAVYKNSTPSIAKLILKKTLINKFKQNLLDQAYILKQSIRPKIEQILKFSKSRNIQQLDEQEEAEYIIPTFNPMNSTLYYWDLLNLFFDFLSLWYCAYFASILGFQQFDIIFNIIILVNTGLEILLNFNRPILMNGEYQKSRISILKGYFYGSFILDFSCFLTQFIQTLFISNSQNILQSLVIVQIIVTIIRVIKKWQSSLSQIYLKEYQRNILDLVTLLLTLYFFAHISACFWYFIGDKTSNLGSWIIKYEYENKTNSEKYNAAFYWATMTMVTVGYGDLTASNSYEILFSNIMMLVSSCVFGYSMNSIGMILKTIQDSNQKYKKTLYLINSYMSQNSVNYSIQNRIRNYLQLQNEREPNENIQELNKIIEDIPQELRFELQLDIQQKILANMKVLQKLFSQQTLNSIAQNLQKLMIFPGQIIIEQQKSRDDCLYYIQQGSVSVIEEKSQKQLNIINAGNTFGEYQFFTNFLPLQTIKAQEFCVIYKLERKQFIQILKRNHKDFEKFHHVKDEMILYQDFSKLNIKCPICQDNSHLEILCPKIQYIPNLETILKKDQFKDQANLRQDFASRNSQKINSLDVNKQILVSIKGYLQQEISQLLGFTSGNQESPTNIKKLDFKSNTFTVSENEPYLQNVVQVKSVTMKSQNVLEPLPTSQLKNQNDQRVETEINIINELEKIDQRIMTDIDKISSYTDYMVQNNIKNVIAKIGKRMTQEKVKFFQEMGKYTFFWNVKQQAYRLKDYFES